MLEHEIDLFGCYFLGSYDEIAFIFTILIVCHNDEFPLTEIIQSFFYSVDFHMLFVALNAIIQFFELDSPYFRIQQR